jgi:hypothetical protein
MSLCLQKRPKPSPITCARNGTRTPKRSAARRRPCSCRCRPRRKIGTDADGRMSPRSLFAVMRDLAEDALGDGESKRIHPHISSATTSVS